jgi:hypothetical protein
MSHRAKSTTSIAIIELHDFLNRMLVDSPQWGRADQPQPDNHGNGAGRGNGTWPRNNGCGNGGNGNGGKQPRLYETADGPKDNNKGKNMGNDKGKLRNEW